MTEPSTESAGRAAAASAPSAAATSAAAAAAASASATSAATSAAEAAAASRPRIDIVGGNPTPIEVAAVTAVLAGVLEEISGHVEADVTRRESAWQRTQRPIRTPLRTGAGMWRGFSG